MGILKKVQAKTIEAVGKCIETTEKCHLAVTNKAFDAAQKVENTARSFAVVKIKDRHNELTTKAFTQVRKLNAKADNITTTIIEKIETQVEKVKGKIEKRAEKIKPLLPFNKKVEETTEA